jgi:hypothetical protein
MSLEEQRLAALATAPLPIPEGAGQASSPQHALFVSYQAGTKITSRTILTPFEDITTQQQVAGVMKALSDMHGGKTISLIFWKALEA